MDNEKLIECVKRYPCIYDLNDKRYNDNQKKDAVWKEIGKKLRCHENDCKKSWALLRDCYRRAVKKHKIDTKNGQPGITKKWKYEDEMSFVLPYLKERAPSMTQKYVEEINFSSHLENEIPASPADDQNDQHNDLLMRSTTPLSVPISPKRRLAFGKSKRAIEETPSTALMKYILENQSDDIEQFFSGIATTVKFFPLRDRAVAKARVFKVISDMEIEILNRPSSSFRRSSMSPHSDDSFQHGRYCETHMTDPQDASEADMQHAL